MQKPWIQRPFNLAKSHYILRKSPAPPKPSRKSTPLSRPIRIRSPDSTPPSASKNPSTKRYSKFQTPSRNWRNNPVPMTPLPPKGPTRNPKTTATCSRSPRKRRLRRIAGFHSTWEWPSSNKCMSVTGLQFRTTRMKARSGKRRRNFLPCTMLMPPKNPKSTGSRSTSKPKRKRLPKRTTGRIF